MDLKRAIIQRIQEIDNPLALETLFNFLNAESLLEKLSVLSSDEKKAVESSLKDIESNGTLSNDEAQLIIKEWLKLKSDKDQMD